MPASPARTALDASIEFEDILSDDGTRLRAWSNDPHGTIDGPTVVLCNGLGTNAWAWPALLDPGCGVRVVSWNHRGTGGSDRPADPRRVQVEHFVEDALSVMDHYGVDRSVLMGWSVGVNTMFELTVRHPERVTGLFAVAGVPGDTFSTMLGPLQLPRLAAKAVTVSLARAFKLGGKALTPVARRLPVGPRSITFLSHTGFMFTIPDPELAAVAVKEFLTTPVDWYMHLAVNTARHPRVSLRDIKVPVVMLAATYDLMAGPRQMATAAERLADASYVELHGTHFIQMEQPERVHQILRDFLARVG